MLKDVGCSHVLVGHSERRALYGESDALVAQKFIAALACGLQPILCLGETLDEREANQTEIVLGRQIAAVVDAAGIGAVKLAVMAYESRTSGGEGKKGIG